MKILPWWKIRRELSRPFKQLLSLPIRMSSFLFGRIFYDRFLKNKASIRKGARQFNKKICLYVIYPSSTECATQLLTIKSILNDSFSLIVVSNKTLTSQVREQILEQCSVLIERVNFGYDFGAYRDGILFLKHHGYLRDIEHLWLLNDSCWYPMSDRSWPQLALEKSSDFVGATSAFGLPKNLGVSDSGAVTDYRVTSRNFHYASYSLMISRKVVCDTRFIQFFCKLAISNNKRYTVRRGEIGLTQLILRMNYSHCDTHETSGIKNTLTSLSDNELRMLIENLTTLNRNFLRLGKEKALAGFEGGSCRSNYDRVFAEDFVVRCVARQGLCYTLPVWLIEKNSFQFLKKSLSFMNSDNKKIIQSFANSSLSVSNDIRKEMLR